MLESLLNAFNSVVAFVSGARKREADAKHEENRKEAEAEVERRKKEGKP
jgi:hypothetical protein